MGRTVKAQSSTARQRRIVPAFQESRLTFALPKGRLLERALTFLEARGLPAPTFRGRELWAEAGGIRYLLVKPADLPTYVEYGAADLGILGEDLVRESGRNLLEPLTLPLVQMRLSLIGPPRLRGQDLRLLPLLRIGTKYPRLTQAYFRRRGIPVEIVPIQGSAELAPLFGLAEAIVDIVETGRTIRENGLVELEVLHRFQACLVVNRASYRLKLERIREVVEQLGG